MANHGVSVVVSVAMSMVLLASETLLRSTLSSSQPLTIVAGFISSIMFVFLLSAISNLEMALFGKTFQAKIPEVVLSLLLACVSAGLVHRVSVTTCLIFSLIALYHLDRISTRVYQNTSESTLQYSKGKKSH